MSKDICFIDFETTGPDIYYDYPTELGAVILATGEDKIEKEFSSFIKIPENAEVTESAYRIHGLNRKDLENAPAPDKVLKNFFSKMGFDYSFGGWNIAFDVGFFRRICYECGYKSQYMRILHRHVDVQSIVRGLVDAGVFPKGIESLSNLCKKLGILRPVKHTALSDARITAEMYVYLTKKILRKV